MWMHSKGYKKQPNAMTPSPSTTEMINITTITRDHTRVDNTEGMSTKLTPRQRGILPISPVLPVTRRDIWPRIAGARPRNPSRRRMDSPIPKPRRLIWLQLDSRSYHQQQQFQFTRRVEQQELTSHPTNLESSKGIQQRESRQA